MSVDEHPLISCRTYLKNRRGRHPFPDKKGTSTVFAAHVFGHLRPSIPRGAERLHCSFSIGDVPVLRHNAALPFMEFEMTR